jgi:hypothetical protein
MSGHQVGRWSVSAVSLAHRSLKKIQQRESTRQSLPRCVATPAPSRNPDPGDWTPSSYRHPGPRQALSRPSNCLVRLGVLLVVLCSKQTRGEQVAERVSNWPGQRHSISSPRQLDLPKFSARTSDRAFETVNASRKSDLSAKRNIGLLLARSMAGTRSFLLMTMSPCRERITSHASRDN